MTVPSKLTVKLNLELQYSADIAVCTCSGGRRQKIGEVTVLDLDIILTFFFLLRHDIRAHLDTLTTARGRAGQFAPK